MQPILTSPGRRRTPGVTLTEISVVIGIVLLLSLILYPVIFRSGDNSRVSKCLANTRQMVVAINMYCQDNGEKLPPDNGESWAACLTSYNRGTIYDCPSKTGWGSNANPEYGFFAPLFGMALGKVKDPSITLLLTDRTMGNPPANYALTDMERDIDPRHTKRASVACVDGSARPVSFADAGGHYLNTLLLQGYEMFPRARLVDTAATEELGGPMLLDPPAGKAIRSTLLQLPAEVRKIGNVLPAGVRIEGDWSVSGDTTSGSFFFTLYQPGTRDTYVNIADLFGPEFLPLARSIAFGYHNSAWIICVADTQPTVIVPAAFPANPCHFSVIAAGGNTLALRIVDRKTHAILVNQAITRDFTALLANTKLAAFAGTYKDFAVKLSTLKIYKL